MNLSQSDDTTPAEPDPSLHAPVPDCNSGSDPSLSDIDIGKEIAG
jgi:hypothetical protein